MIYDKLKITFTVEVLSNALDRRLSPVDCRVSTVEQLMNFRCGLHSASQYTTAGGGRAFTFFYYIY